MTVTDATELRTVPRPGGAQAMRYPDGPHLSLARLIRDPHPSRVLPRSTGRRTRRSVRLRRGHDQPRSGNLCA
jgi:hypothetical protein